MDEMVQSSANEAFATTPGTGSGGVVTASNLESEGRNGVFTSLVKADDDITGLVAYSIFKQNELDWLTEFHKAKGREPTPDETDAYILGESTSRRLATYRHLADATLGGKGPEVATQGGGRRVVATRNGHGIPALGGNSVLAYVAIALVILVAVYFAVRAGVFK